MFTKHIDNLDVDTSLLGFGCMRFPTVDNKIDEEKAEAMIDRAYAAGVNYFDTAYPYHDGASEPFVGRVLNKYPRDSYYLATKLPLWKIKTLDDAKQLFEEQLRRVDKDYIDFYLFHSFGRDSFENMKKLGVIEYLESEKAAGRIRFLGFSFHDSFEVFKDILEYRKWDFCQIQLNYMDVDVQAGMAGYALAESLGVPMIIMEPVKGGSLANIPEDSLKFFHKLDSNASPASWALRFVGSLSNVKVVLSGMSDPSQLEDNLATFSDFKPLTEEEQEAVENTAEFIRKRVFNGCTGCRYCMPCPAGIDIPYNFSIWNQFGMYQNEGHTKWVWNNQIDDSKKAKNCLSCGQCEAACPQKLNIRDDLATLQKQLDNL